MTTLRRLRLVAVDCDGVLINDTYLAVLERFVTRHGGVYDEEAERLIVGLQDVVVADLVAQLCGLDQPVDETLAAIFAEREEYLREHPIRVSEGVPEFLAALQEFDVRVVCYGGRIRQHTFDRYLAHLVEFFDPAVPYVSVNEHRPGVDWIVRDVIGCDFDEAVFIDDVSRVAEAARLHRTGFIGVPAGPAHGRQRHFLEEAGVRHVVGSVGEITPHLLSRVDEELIAGEHWRPVR